MKLFSVQRTMRIFSVTANNKIIIHKYKKYTWKILHKQYVIFIFKKRLLTSNKIFTSTVIPFESVRMNLPAKRDPNESLNIWSLLKDAIGKDLTKFAVPGNYYKYCINYIIYIKGN